MDWIATDADLRLRGAQETYDEACKKQSAADSVSAKKTIRQYKPRCSEARARLNEAWLHVEMWYEYEENYDTAYAKCEEISKNYSVIMKTYKRAVEELAAARGEMVKKAEDDLERVKSDRKMIIAYRCVFNSPSEEWTREDSILLKHIYNFCQKAERDGSDHHISMYLVEYMQGLE